MAGTCSCLPSQAGTREMELNWAQKEYHLLSLIGLMLVLDLVLKIQWLKMTMMCPWMLILMVII